jgi:hypothetical protein
MLRLIRPLLRLKGKKTMPRQGSLDYRQQLKEKIQPLNEPLTTPELPSSDEIQAPRHLAKLGLLGTIPGLAGTFGMLISDINSPLFHTYAVLTGTWVGTTIAFYGGSVAGFELMSYRPRVSVVGGRVYTTGRLWYSLAHLCMFVLCVWSSVKESWRGFIACSLGMGSSCIYAFSAMAYKTLPMWFSSYTWVWALYNCSLSMYLVYSFFIKETIRLKAARS